MFIGISLEVSVFLLATCIALQRIDIPEHYREGLLRDHTVFSLNAPPVVTVEFVVLQTYG
jgi:hypothetical protein